MKILGRRELVVTLLGLALVALGCGGGDDSGPPEPQSGAQAAKRHEPDVILPDRPPPGRLVADDLIEGSGDVARVGDELTVEYVGVLYNGSPFASSTWKRREPFSFQLGSDDPLVSPGWERGLAGMRVGGRRELIVPPGLLGGESDLPEDSAEGTVIYVIDLLQIG